LIYCDSSFLLSLYLGTESLSTAARQTALSFEEAIALVWLTELEVLTTLYRTHRGAVLRKTLAALEAAHSEGILVRCALPGEAYQSKALELSKQQAARTGCRTLDILHVAFALELASSFFVSFDQRQRRLAQTVGLKVLPHRLPPGSL
jgi:predicted nucleic acid-binding protein